MYAFNGFQDGGDLYHVIVSRIALKEKKAQVSRGRVENLGREIRDRRRSRGMTRVIGILFHVEMAAGLTCSMATRSEARNV